MSHRDYAYLDDNRREDGTFGPSSAKEADDTALGSGSAVKDAYATYRLPPATFDPEGPGSWGSYSSNVTLHHEVQGTSTDGRFRVVPAGEHLVLRTSFENRLEGEHEGSQPLRFRVVLETSTGDVEIEDTSHLTNVDASAEDEQRFDAVENVHTAMRYAAEQDDPHAFSRVAESMSQVCADSSRLVDFRLPVTSEARGSTYEAGRAAGFSPEVMNTGEDGSLRVVPRGREGQAEFHVDAGADGTYTAWLATTDAEGVSREHDITGEPSRNLGHVMLAVSEIADHYDMDVYDRPTSTTSATKLSDRWGLGDAKPDYSHLPASPF